MDILVECEFLGDVIPFEVGVGGTTLTPFGIGGSGMLGGGEANDCTLAVFVLKRPENSEVLTPAALLTIVSCSS